MPLPAGIICRTLEKNDKTLEETQKEKAELL